MNINEIHKDKPCERCGRKYPETILNIEGFLHHGNKLECLDRKNCRKVQKKRSKK